ncbi:hypothetical protein CN367_11865 [Priestia megaterium]|nr:hypothetical protein CN367_11865 [Priestia megaterium]
MRAGKDEAFKILNEFGFDCERVAFGDIMKERFHETFPWIPMEPKPIAELIEYGQAMRKIDPDVWVRPTMARMKMRIDSLAQAGLMVPSFIATDVRQPNELEALEKAGFTIVYIHAHENVRIDRMVKAGETVSEKILNAPTELHIDDWLAQERADYVVTNNGDRKQFEKNLTELVYKIQSEKGKN